MSLTHFADVINDWETSVKEIWNHVSWMTCIWMLQVVILLNVLWNWKQWNAVLMFLTSQHWRLEVFLLQNIIIITLWFSKMTPATIVPLLSGSWELLIWLHKFKTNDHMKLYIKRSLIHCYRTVNPVINVRAFNWYLEDKRKKRGSLL